MLTFQKEIYELIESYKDVLKDRKIVAKYKVLGIRRKDIESMLKFLKEIKPIGYKNVYDKYGVNEKGTVINIFTKRVLALDETPKGYKKVKLYIEDKKENMFIHKLVKSAFSNIDYKTKVTHIDNNKQNNNIKNLKISDKEF